MSTPRNYRKFSLQQKKIEALEQSSPRFRRIFSEYEIMSHELWELENSDKLGITDDFLNSVRLQTDYLEEEIEDWLLDEPADS